MKRSSSFILFILCDSAPKKEKSFFDPLRKPTKKDNSKGKLLLLPSLYLELEAGFTLSAQCEGESFTLFFPLTHFMFECEPALKKYDHGVAFHVWVSNMQSACTYTEPPL